MKLFDDFKRRRAEKLAEKGYELVEDEEFDQALIVAAELDRLQYSAGFEIAALAHAGKGDIPAAVRVLEDGVEKGPDAWLNWQLLGNYRSDLGLYSEAARAYERALECPGVSPSSIRLNQAILANRTGNYPEALRLADEADDPELKLWVTSVRIGALTEMGEEREVERLGLQALSEAGEDADPGRLCSIVADIARVRLHRGDSRDDVRAFITQWLEREPGNPDLLAIIREIDGLSSEAAQYYRLLLRGHTSEDEDFYCHWHVVADSPEEALGFVRALDVPPAELSVEEWEIIEPRPNEPKGVYWRSGRVYFEEEE